MAKLQSHPLFSSAVLCFLFPSYVRLPLEESVTGEVKHGQDFVRTLATATASAGPGRRPYTELVKHNFLELHASANLDVNPLSIRGDSN
ncbi:hypothetical protein PanWU01x14_191820 [Parasponia andersonii]|uniref:Uncharacterized protein n=1 Tax=Parasponia andersonii TaxID=3476 RepID=A0A2P5C1P5_PARAD|nr:hypothetical protein PanWU01x14_191820 [Parasponia andersonii]